MSHLNFRDIHFGFASAETERAEDPRLLLEGYYDVDDLINQVIGGNKFLFLGYKGSGKSAIGQKLTLLSGQKNNLRASVSFIADFPYSAFNKVTPGDSSPESRYPTSWEWILLLQVINSIRQDTGSTIINTPNFQRMCRALEGAGLLAAYSLKQLVLTSAKANFKAKIPTLLEAGFEGEFSSQEVAMTQLVGFLQNEIRKFKSSTKHILVIDGLDDILTNKDVQYQSLAALVLGASRLNRSFQSEGNPIKIVLLCRPDLFENLPGTNKNKIRRDSAITLNWYHDTREVEQSRLVSLANLRAHLSGMEENLDVFKTYFPEKIEPHSTSTLKFLLDHTRHTPRDFIQLLSSIQKMHASGPSKHATKISSNIILSGLREYSIEYFLPEIKDEMVGVGDISDTNDLLQLISRVNRRDFQYEELRTEAVQSGLPRLRDLDLELMLRGLFECSAIGNVRRSNGEHIHTFKYRNRSSFVDFSQRFMLHRGVWKALNIV